MNFIYCFECITDCKVKGRKYIGSTTNLKLRYFWHLKQFKDKTHCNPELMKWYNKKNVKFKFYILEKVENKQDLLQREQYYIDLNIANCFNLVDVDGNFLNKPKKSKLKDIRINPKRSNKQQRAINKFIKTSKSLKRCC